MAGGTGDRHQHRQLRKHRAAITGAEEGVSVVLEKARFWQRFATENLNERQIKVLNRVLESLEGKLTNAKWARLAKCSSDTALRDITDLVERGALKKDQGGGRSTSYSLVRSQGSWARRTKT